MARTDYPFNSENQKCSITTVFVVLNINRGDADLKSIDLKVRELLQKNKIPTCKTLQGCLNRLIRYYCQNENALPTNGELSLYAESERKQKRKRHEIEVIDLTFED